MASAANTPTIPITRTNKIAIVFFIFSFLLGAPLLLLCKFRFSCSFPEHTCIIGTKETYVNTKNKKVEKF